MALSKAKEFGFDTVACTSTGNLANSVSAQAAIAKLKSYIFIPANLETGKIVASLVYKPRVIAVEGNYDQVNRLCTEISQKYKWAFVNINLRPYYAEGGWAESVSDEEVVETIKLLASTKGIFTETARGVTLGVAKKLIEQGIISKDESIVICITGNGLKTQEVVLDKLGEIVKIKPNLSSFEEKLSLEVENVYQS